MQRFEAGITQASFPSIYSMLKMQKGGAGMLLAAWFTKINVVVKWVGNTMRS